MYMSLNDSRVSMTSTALLSAAAGANGLTMRGATAPPRPHLRSLTRQDDCRLDTMLRPARRSAARRVATAAQCPPEQGRTKRPLRADPQRREPRRGGSEEARANRLRSGRFRAQGVSCGERSVRVRTGTGLQGQLVPQDACAVRPTGEDADELDRVQGHRAGTAARGEGATGRTLELQGERIVVPRRPLRDDVGDDSPVVLPR